MKLRNLFGFFKGKRSKPAAPLRTPVPAAADRLDVSARGFLFSEPPVPREPAVEREPTVPHEPRLSHSQA